MIFLIGLIFGALTGWLFRRLTNGRAVREIANRIVARLLELRLFLDEPVLVLRAQRALVAENLHLLRHLAIPIAIGAALFALLFQPLDRRFGHGPDIRPGRPIVMSAPLGAELRVPEGAVIETPALRIPRLHQTVWRVRPASSPGAPRMIAGLPWEVWFATSAICGAVLVAFL